MNLQNIEAIADQACFSTDPQVKLQAEKLFIDFTFNLDLTHYQEVMQKYSQTVLFVFLSYLNRKLPLAHQDLVQIFNNLRILAASWCQKNAQFKRTYQQQPLKSYVANTLGMVLGNCAKHIFLKQEWQKQLIEYFQIETNNVFKLFIYKNMIENVSTIDNELDYVKYRTLIYCFQDKMIPLILQEIYPYFIGLVDTIKVNELSNMLPRLEDNSCVQQDLELFREEDKYVSTLVFTLLKEIVSFKYDISFSEYDLETEFQNCMVSFPESVLRNISAKEFLESFYFMLEKMVLTNYSGLYLDISFECLKKILLSKNTHLTKNQMLALTRIHYHGLLRLLKHVISSQKIIILLFECLFKFIHAFQFTDLQKAGINHFEMIQLIKQKAISAIQSIQLCNQNQLYHATCSLVFKITSESIAASQEKYLPFYRQLSCDFYVTFFNSFITYPRLIFSKIPNNRISSLQPLIDEFFFHINRIATMDMKFLFTTILSNLQQVFFSQNQTIIANFLFLITTIIEENFYDRSLVYQTTTDETLKILGNIIHKCFQFIDYYKKNPTPNQMIDIAVLLFFQKILDQCLGGISGDDSQIKITSSTYRLINSYKSIQITDENFLSFCFQQLCLRLYTESHQTVDYILQILYRLLLKLKWGVKRQLFIQSQVFKQLLEKTIELSRNSLQSSAQLLKERRKLFKIITVLSFDDVLDFYRTNIDFIVEAITYDFNNHQYAKIVFDMSGICENINTSIIYTYFLAKLNQQIGLQQLIKTLYENFGNDISMLQSVVFLNKVLIADKSLRMTTRQISIRLYELIDYSLPFLSIILASVNAENAADLEKETLSFVNMLLEASYINFFLIKRKSNQNLSLFIQKLLDNILRNHTWAIQYPQLSKQLFQTTSLFLINISQVILVSEQTLLTQSQLISKQIQFIQFTMFYCINNLQQVSGGGKDYSTCEKLLNSISKFYSLVKYKKNYTHKKLLINNITFIERQNEECALNFLQSLYKLSMSNLRNKTTILNQMCIAIMQLSLIYTNAYKSIFLSLGISSEKTTKFQKIYKNILRQENDCLFVINLKQWLSNSDKNYQQEIEY